MTYSNHHPYRALTLCRRKTGRGARADSMATRKATPRHQSTRPGCLGAMLSTSRQVKISPSHVIGQRLWRCSPARRKHVVRAPCPPSPKNKKRKRKDATRPNHRRIKHRRVKTPTDLRASPRRAVDQPPPCLSPSRPFTPPRRR